MSAGAAMPLEQELRTYAEHLSELLDRAGQFVLIRGDQVLGVFVAYEDAVNAGYAQCQLDPFLVRKIEPEEQVQLITRLVSCPISPETWIPTAP